MKEPRFPILPGSMFTHAWWSETFWYCELQNNTVNVAQKLSKSVKICTSCCKHYTATYGSHGYICNIACGLHSPTVSFSNNSSNVIIGKRRPSFSSYMRIDSTVPGRPLCPITQNFTINAEQSKLCTRKYLVPLCVCTVCIIKAILDN